LAADLTAFISLKSGDVVGEREVGLRLNSPDGKPRPVKKWLVRFNGQDHGVNLTIAFTLTSPQYGLYWFDVLCADHVLTRIPFRLKPRTTESLSDESSETAMRR
jgi:hypothetical protein